MTGVKGETLESGSVKKVRVKNEEYNYSGREVELDLEFVEGEIKRLQGKVLTVIDATVNIPAQNKAVKDIIKGQFNNLLSEILFSAYPDLQDATGKQMFDLKKEHPEIDSN